MKEQSKGGRHPVGMATDESLPQGSLEPLHHYGPVASCGLTQTSSSKHSSTVNITWETFVPHQEKVSWHAYNDCYHVAQCCCHHETHSLQQDSMHLKVLDCSPYSLDIPPCDFTMCSASSKKMLKGQRNIQGCGGAVIPAAVQGVCCERIH
jgi:hypothetical protein